ncbi:MAG: hypothetical protein EP297_00530 [Gammaproteobacteria bacterium]|nr:MAG: hypothetical protein EP297_00530 [Gammaproteobacteria bacterium]
MSQPGFHHALKVGYQLHWYTIDQVLGQGGFGITYLAHDNNLDQRVAIKEFLPTEFAARGEDNSVNPVTQDKDEVYRWALDRFLKEARTLAKFDHPNIVRVLAVFEANNAAYIVMRYETGETLEQHFNTHGILSESEILSILLPIIDGLELVHREGFIHRDIKPANIFIREDHSPVLIDFGAARQAIGEHTHNLTAMVSTGYSAIEQYYSKAEDQGAWTDIYGLASIAYYCLTGIRPVDAMTRGKDILAGKADPYVPSMQAGQGHFTTAFLNAIDQGMQFMPEDRPQDLTTWKRYLVHTDISGEQVTQLANEAKVISTTEFAQSPQPIGMDRLLPRSRLIGWVSTAMVLAVFLATGMLLYDHKPDQQILNNDSFKSQTTKSKPSQLVNKHAHSIPSILVFPFRNIGDNKEDDYFIDGMTEDIITDLSKLSSLLVIASQTSMSLKNRGISALEAGHELGTNYILDGSIRRLGSDLRINIQLIDVSNGAPLWAERYDKKLDNIFIILEEITNHIVEALALQLTLHEKKTFREVPEVDFEAYDMFLKGQRNYNRRTKESVAEAIAAYLEAIRLDPTFARAYGAYAVALAMQYRMGWTDAPNETLNRALEMAEKAVSIDSSIPQVHWALSYVNLRRKEYEKATKAVKEAISIAPNYADAHALLAVISNIQGNTEEAIKNIKKGMQINPYYSFEYPYNLGRAYYLSGDHPEAIVYLSKALEMNGTVFTPRLYLIASYIKQGFFDEAEWEVEQLLTQNPDMTISKIRLIHPDKKELLDALLDDLRTAGLPE